MMQSSLRAQGIKNRPRKIGVCFLMARPEGLEPSTYRLTAGRSTIELRANKLFLTTYLLYLKKNTL